MDKNQGLNKSEQLLRKGKIEQCLNNLIEITRISNKEFYKRALYLDSQLNKIKYEENLGLRDGSIEINKITSSVVDLIFEVRSNVEYSSVLEEKEIIDFPVVPYSENFNAGEVFIRGKKNGIYGWGYSESAMNLLNNGLLGFTPNPDQKKHSSLSCKQYR